MRLSSGSNVRSSGFSRPVAVLHPSRLKAKLQTETFMKQDAEPKPKGLIGAHVAKATLNMVMLPLAALPGIIVSGWITDRIGLSARRFIEVFRHEVGMPPKVFARVHRFQGLFRQPDGNESGFCGRLGQGRVGQAHGRGIGGPA